MAPSPLLRRSPGWENRADSHKRGRSLESGLNLREKEDDLALFSEMHRREREDFLLQSEDDFEDVFSTKLKSFRDSKLEITIPTQGQSSDLLNADGDKNDYDWLLTPPDTPLFPSLDDEPSPSNIVHSGRPRSRSIAISKSPTMEKSNRSNKGSYSPQRLSPSPRSASSTTHGQPSSAPHSSPSPTLRHSASSRKPSPTPPPRFSTPTLRRPSVGSDGTGVSSAMRGTSPIRTSRGNSPSPKVRAWQSNIPGFSMDAPPNLRTSLSDRPASYVRGSSPASRNSRDSTSASARQSLSPTASTSINSLHTRERVRFSVYNKASSGDDDVETMQSIHMGSLERSIPRKAVSGFSNSHPSGFSKKHSKTVHSTSAPKRSFDSATRQMDRKSQQDMFRPLLSSVPSTTFHSGKASSSHRVLMSMNSSFTTSSNASSDQATSGAPDTEESDQYQDDVTSKCGKGHFPDPHDEVFPFDVMEGASEDTGNEPLKGLPSLDKDKGYRRKSHPDSEGVNHREVPVLNALASEALHIGIQSHGYMLLCALCGCMYLPAEVKQSDVNICPECKLQAETSTERTQMLRVSSVQNPLTMMPDGHGLQETVEPFMTLLQQAETVEMTEPHENNVQAKLDSIAEQPSCCLADSPPASVAKESMQMLLRQHSKGQSLSVSGLSDFSYQSGDSHKSVDSSRAKVDFAEGAGISVLLLKRSTSSIGPILQSRNITATAISYEDSSYARDSTASMRSSTDYDNVSASSSTDMILARHAEVLMQRQLSGRRSEMSSKPQSHMSSFSGTSAHAYQALGVSTSTETCEMSVGSMSQISQEHLHESFAASGYAELPDTWTSTPRRTPLENNGSSRAKDNDAREVSSHNFSMLSDGNSPASFPDDVFHGMDEAYRAVNPEISVEGDAIPDNNADQLSEMDIDDYHPSSPTSQTEMTLEDDYQKPSIKIDQDEDVKDSVPVSCDSGFLHGVIVESTVVVEEQASGMTRSLTLEEPTDSILFCRSIIHDLAYEAATIAIEKEKGSIESIEGSRPSVMPSGKTKSDNAETRGRTPSRRSPKSRRAQQRLVETKAEPPPPSCDTEADGNKVVESTTRTVVLQNKVDSTKPPKLESKCNCTIM
ncbi:hypothetical protein AKJ16_DCAP20522 [Drosera capensis]